MTFEERWTFDPTPARCPRSRCLSIRRRVKPYYDVGIPGTYDHISASGRPEYNLNTEQQPGAAPVATKTGQHGCGSRCSYPDFGSIAKTAPAGG
jgi:hypothetical protein